MGVGGRVVRGRDWRYRNQDGGIGKQGTIRQVFGKGLCWVKWDSAGVNTYAIGSGKKFELEYAKEQAALSSETWAAIMSFATSKQNSHEPQQADEVERVHEAVAAASNTTECKNATITLDTTESAARAVTSDIIEGASAAAAASNTLECKEAEVTLDMTDTTRGAVTLEAKITIDMTESTGGAVTSDILHYESQCLSVETGSSTVARESQSQQVEEAKPSSDANTLSDICKIEQTDEANLIADDGSVVEIVGIEPQSKQAEEAKPSANANSACNVARIEPQLQQESKEANPGADASSPCDAVSKQEPLNPSAELGLVARRRKTFESFEDSISPRVSRQESASQKAEVPHLRADAIT